MPRCSRGHRPHSVCPDATESNLPVSIADDPLTSVVLARVLLLLANFGKEGAPGSGRQRAGTSHRGSTNPRAIPARRFPDQVRAGPVKCRRPWSPRRAISYYVCSGGG